MTSASTLFLPGTAPAGASARAAVQPAAPAPSRAAFSQALQQARERPVRDAQPPRARSEAERPQAAKERTEASEQEEPRNRDAAETPRPPDDNLFAFASAAAPVDPAACPEADAGEATLAGADLAGLQPDAAQADTAARSTAKAASAAVAGVEPQAIDLSQAIDETAALAAEEAEALLQQAVQEAGSASARAPAASLHRAPEAPVGLAALHASAPASATSTSPAAAAAATRQIDAPLDSPEFPDSFAAQIGYLVRDGVQHARLTLNPAEMGPISVQIAVQGQQAQVDFAAASAATRSAIEGSLSHLAAALQEAGLTLSGGGVSQHHDPRPQGRPADEGRAGGMRGSAAGDADAPTQRAAAPRHAVDGRLDLYA